MTRAAKGVRELAQMSTAANVADGGCLTTPITCVTVMVHHML